MCGKTSKGRFTVVRQTIRKRLHTKLSEVKVELRRRMHDPIPEVGKWLRFRLFPGTIRSPRIIEFLSHLMRHIPGKLLIIWDGLPGHHSRAVWDFVGQQRGRLWLEYLPGYAGAADKAVNLVGCKSPHHQLPGRVVSRSDACGGDDACSARMSKPRLPCGDESQR